MRRITRLQVKPLGNTIAQGETTLTPLGENQALY